jgi:hypothetical protein
MARFAGFAECIGTGFGVGGEGDSGNRSHQGDKCNDQFLHKSPFQFPCR